ncbi:FKBP-type peptidyl-prolyl cis-trans isomerase [Lysobacter sp. A286]
MRRMIPRLAISTMIIAMLAACTPSQPPAGGSVDELQRIDLKTGSGEVAAPGDTVDVHYTGWLYDQDAPDQHGKQFDSSRERGEPITFLLGAGRVIRGWDEGVAGMRVGGQRILLIPAAYGYGRKGAGGAIPPGASLVFEVELIGVRKP